MQLVQKVQHVQIHPAEPRFLEEQSGFEWQQPTAQGQGCDAQPCQRAQVSSTWSSFCTSHEAAAPMALGEISL